MPAKTPMYLKTPMPKRGKKLNLRDVLCSNMISPPLGDFRHNAHVGLEGENDMFGDVEFLQGKTDMLPASAHPPHPSLNYIGSHFDHTFDGKHKDIHSHSNLNPISHLKNTISMPIFIAHEQAPPKPPRLHLEESSSSKQQQKNHHTQQQRSMSVCEEAVGHYKEPLHDLTISTSIPVLEHLAPSAVYFSEASSDDSMSEVCGPLDPKRGLSLDSDAGLSNEDLQSECSVSPGLSPVMSRSESLAGLDLDLGPSILEDVLRIMDRYKSENVRCDELAKIF
ncbi:cdc42 effector protein 3 [Trichomycterus rosablanca]|uniref:cdc42 effector protein 3 n=1 Tax=Trichomycterus rosablanca TaxID=2290929 RepID=UPI002F3601EA